MNAMGAISSASIAAATLSDPLADRGDTRRWGTALAIVLAVHALPMLVVALWTGAGSPPTALTPEPAVFIDLAPPAAPPEPPSERPPGPREEPTPEPMPTPERRIETPAPNPEVAIPDPPPAPPKPVAQATAPPVQPLPPAPRASSGQPTWEGQVLGRLNQFKRYPNLARRAGRQGAPHIRFVMNREGRVLSSRLERSSGFKPLDEEAVALPARAQPLPGPPEGVGGATLELVVPVEFFLK